ncbi:unnamed protein product [Didymodactylos carnosus]|uniref:BZIP domain-containing protein n=1 Tax=Didymodactylos carnosus TaxID=1234261 RepID=A0A814GCU9_9BILA|nr:unnamed protein product [Didymodactylos carnosus]CAF0993927.1 unnamed protein product [Didymodactylos carnosus]CAF3708942.1 unnamed protein product [Didymodactylos carnosus]CAF3765696.1 unnamed protein product [Didymodactylos carnosus]
MNLLNGVNSNNERSYVYPVDLSLSFDEPTIEADFKVSSSIDPVAQIEKWLRSPSTSPPLVNITQQPIIIAMYNDSNVVSSSVQNSSPSSSSSHSEKRKNRDRQTLSDGHVKYGPITVNPRKRPAKTLFTGRKSKYEILPPDEEEKRRMRRERNRVAATKCREKREDVITFLEKEHETELNKNAQLKENLRQLKKKHEELEKVLMNHSNVCQLNQNQSRAINDQQLMCSTSNNYLVNTSMIDDSLPSSLSNSIEEMLFGDTARTSFSDINTTRGDYNAPIVSSSYHHVCTTTNKADEANNYLVQIPYTSTQLKDNYFLTNSNYLEQQNQSLLLPSSSFVNDQQQQNYNHLQPMVDLIDRNPSTRMISQDSGPSVVQSTNISENIRQMFTYEMGGANNTLITNCAREFGSSSEEDSSSPTLTPVF